MISACCSFNILVIRWALTLDPPDGQNPVLGSGGSEQKSGRSVFQGGGSQITGGGSESWGGGAEIRRDAPQFNPWWHLQQCEQCAADLYQTTFDDDASIQSTKYSRLPRLRYEHFNYAFCSIIIFLTKQFNRVLLRKTALLDVSWKCHNLSRILN